ncbi:MAG: hypothetical protein V4737_14700, partial [Curtobacterium sp.]
MTTKHHRQRRRHRGRPRWSRRLWLAAFALLAATTPSTAAYAASGDQSAAQRFVGSLFLPISRWYTATTDLRSNTSGNWLSVGVETVVRLAQSAGIAVSNYAWLLTQSFIDFASTFNPLSTSLGRDIDDLIHTLGDVVLTGGSKTGPLLLLLIVLVSLGIAARTAMRTQDFRLFARRFLTIGLVIGLFGALVTQSGAGSYNKKTQTYTAAVGSPVWVGQQANTIVNSAIGAVGSALTAAPGTGRIGEDTSNLSCNAMLEGMQVRLAASKASKGSAQSRKAAANTVNQMYVRTALSSYAVAQYGTSKYAQYAWCRGADANATSFGVTSTEFTAYVGWKASTGDRSGKVALFPGTAKSKDGKHSNSAPFGSSQQKQEHWAGNVIAWAACHPTVSDDGKAVRYGIDKAWKQAGVAEPACEQWWGKGGVNAFGDEGKVFTKLAGYDPEDVSEHINDDDVASFLNSISGADQATLSLGATAAVVSAIGSVASLVVIGGLAIGSILAMLMTLLYLFGTVFSLLRALGSEQGFAPVLVSLKATFGALIFGSALSIVLALVSLVTMLLAKVGSVFGDPGNPVSLTWAMLCPVISVVGLHLAFKKLNLPSPVTVSGGMAWGKMLTKGGAAATGGNVGAGLLGGAAGLVKRRASSVGRRALGAATGRGPGRGAAAAGGRGGSGGVSRRGVGRSN